MDKRPAFGGYTIGARQPTSNLYKALTPTVRGYLPVYEAFDADKTAAIVIMPRSVLFGMDDPLRGVRLQARLADPHQRSAPPTHTLPPVWMTPIKDAGTLPVYGYGEQDESIYIACEYVYGYTLHESLLKPHQKGEVMPAEQVIEITSKVAYALEHDLHMHGMVHGALDTWKILIATTGVFITGLYYAHVPDEPDIPHTPQHPAPEQGAGAPITHAADQYALAACAREMLTVPPNAEGRSPADNPTVAAVLKKAQADDPAERYPSCGMFAVALREALQDVPLSTLTPPIQRAAPAPPKAQRPIQAAQSAKPDGAAGKKPARKRKPQQTKLTFPLVAACLLVLTLAFPTLPGIDVPLPLLALPLVMAAWARDVKDPRKFFKRFKWGDWFTLIPLVVWGIGMAGSGQAALIPTMTALISGGLLYAYVQNALKDTALPIIAFVALYLLVLRLFIGMGYAPYAAPIEWGYVALALGAGGLLNASGARALGWLPGIALALAWLALHPVFYGAAVVLAGVTFITTVKAIHLFQRSGGNAKWVYLALTIALDIVLFTAGVNGDAAARGTAASFLGGVLMLLFLTRLTAGASIGLFSFYLLGMVMLLFLGTGAFIDYAWQPFPEQALLVVAGTIGLIVTVLGLILLSVPSIWQQGTRVLGRTVPRGRFLPSSGGSIVHWQGWYLLGCLFPLVTLLSIIVLVPTSLVFGLLGASAVTSGMIAAWAIIGLLALAVMAVSISGGWLAILLVIALIHTFTYGGIAPHTPLALLTALLIIWLWRVRRDTFIGWSAGVVMLALHHLYNGSSAEVWFRWEYAGVLLLLLLIWAERGAIPVKLGLINAARKR